jgi:hypothetical protein
MPTVIITSQIPTGSGFGVTNIGENVFVPAHLMRLHGLTAGQRIEAILADNAPEMQHKTPWRVALVEGCATSGGYGKTQEPEEELAPESIDDAIVSLLLDGGLYSIRDVAKSLLGDGYSTTDKPYYDISNALRRLHNEGHIAAAAVRRAASQGRPSFYLFAASIDDFR